MPDHDMWKAADPVVRRWMVRELSPAARARRFADEAVEAMRNLARLIENPPAPAVAVVEPREHSGAFWFAAGAAVAGAAFLLAALIR
jgi:ubiquinone biosynthesis protein